MHLAKRSFFVILSLSLVAACDDDEEGTSSPAATSSSTSSSTAEATVATSGTGASSSGGAGGQATGGTSSTGGMGMGPGTITIVAQGLTGFDGDLLTASVVVNRNPLGRICETIASGSVSAAARPLDPMGKDTCDLGTTPVVFDEGTYDVRAGIYQQGNPAPVKCAATQVTVAGNVTATLPAFSDCQ